MVSSQPRYTSRMRMRIKTEQQDVRTQKRFWKTKYQKRKQQSRHDTLGRSPKFKSTDLDSNRHLRLEAVRPLAGPKFPHQHAKEINIPGQSKQEIRSKVTSFVTQTQSFYMVPVTQRPVPASFRTSHRQEDNTENPGTKAGGPGGGNINPPKGMNSATE